MTARLAPTLFALVLTLAAPLAQSETLGSALDSALVTGSARSLSGVPAGLLESVHVGSEAVALHGRGLLPAGLAAGVLTDELLELVELQPELEALDDEALRTALLLQGRVVQAGARELALALDDGPERAQLLAAALRLAEATAELTDRRLHAGSDGPDNPCFQHYGDCMEYCSAIDGIVGRSLCGMDCNLDFAACLGRVVGRGGRALIGGMIDVVDSQRGE